MSVIQAGNTTTTSLIYTGDTTGNLVFTTGGANTVALTLANTQAATFSGSVSVSGATTFSNSATATAFIPSGSTVPTNGIYLAAANTISFSTSSAAVARFDSSGRLLIGTTTADARLTVKGTGENGLGVRTTTTSDGIFCAFNGSGSSGSTVYVMPCRFGSTETLGGGLYWNGSVMSLQGTSDYRLKKDVAPLDNALDTVSKLNPVTYTWTNSNQLGTGFIAHEFQKVLPSAVVGEKDAVDENGKIVPQSIDQTQIIVYLTKAIQELKIELDLAKLEITALKGN